MPQVRGEAPPLPRPPVAPPTTAPPSAPGRTVPPGPAPTQARKRAIVEPADHRVRSGLALLLVSVVVGVLSAGFVAAAIALALLALKRAVG